MGSHWRTDGVLVVALVTTAGGLIYGTRLIESWPEQARRNGEEIQKTLLKKLDRTSLPIQSATIHNTLSEMILDPWDWPTVAFAFVLDGEGNFVAGRVNLPYYSCPIFECYPTEQAVLAEVLAGRYHKSNQYHRVGIMTHQFPLDSIAPGAVLTVGSKTLHMKDRLSESMRFGVHFFYVAVCLVLLRVGSRVLVKIGGAATKASRARRIVALEAAWPDLFAVAFYGYAAMAMADDFHGKFPLPGFVYHGLLTYPLFEVIGRFVLGFALIPMGVGNTRHLRYSRTASALLLVALHAFVAVSLSRFFPLSFLDLAWVWLLVVVNQIALLDDLGQDQRESALGDSGIVVACLVISGVGFLIARSMMAWANSPEVALLSWGAGYFLLHSAFAAFRSPPSG